MPRKTFLGAASDLQNATKLAKELVKTFGMSDKAGLRDFTSSMESNGIMVVNDLSQQAKESIDQEISRLLLEAYQRAKEILTKHKVWNPLRRTKK
jgi:ATP-dependent Zn protease